MMAYTFLMMLVLAVIHYNNLLTLSLSFLQEQRSKVFNGAMGYEFDEKLYKSLYDVCLLLIIATCTNNSITAIVTALIFSFPYPLFPYSRFSMLEMVVVVPMRKTGGSLRRRVSTGDHRKRQQQYTGN